MSEDKQAQYPAPKAIRPGTKVVVEGVEYVVVWSSFDRKYLSLEVAQ